MPLWADMWEQVRPLSSIAAVDENRRRLAAHTDNPRPRSSPA